MVHPCDATRKYCSRACDAMRRIGIPNLKLTKRVVKECQHCGKQVSLKYSRVNGFKYCSHSCRASHRTGVASANWKGGLLEKTCATCGSSFRVPKNRSDAKYCSNKCVPVVKVSGNKSYWWKGGKQTNLCKQCGGSFQVFGYRALTAEYCSRKCHDTIRLRRVTMTCKNCGKTYETKQSKATRTSYGNFCSLDCSQTYLVGSKNPHWLGGISFAPYPITFNDRFKKMIRERDNYKCALCGKFGNHVHHINYQKDDVDPHNCVTLCLPCHCKTNFNRDYWERHFKSSSLERIPVRT